MILYKSTKCDIMLSNKVELFELIELFLKEVAP